MGLTNGRAKLQRTSPGLTFCAETTHAIYHWMNSTRPTCAMLFTQPDLNVAKATQTEIAFLCAKYLLKLKTSIAL